MNATYHAALSPLTTIRAGLCVATDAAASLCYLQGRVGYLHTLEMGEADVADEATLKAVARGLGHVADYSFELADRDDVRAALVEAGWDAVSYQDVSPDNGREHATILILVTGVVAVVEVESVEASE